MVTPAARAGLDTHAVEIQRVAKPAVVHVDPTIRVAARVLADLDALADRMVASYRSQVPEYASMAEEVLRTEVRPVSRRVVEAFFEALVAGEEPDASRVSEVSQMGRRRLDMGVPLEPVLHVYRLAGRTVWDAIVAAIGPGEESVLATLGAAWMDYIDRASSAAAAAYLEASHDKIRRADAHRSAIVQALLAASDAADVAAVAAENSTTFSESYTPVVIAASAATTRPDRIAASLPRGTLYGLRAGHLLLLVPQPVANADLARLIEPTTTLAAGHPAAPTTALAAGHPAAPGHSLRDEVRDTEMLLRAAVAAGRTGVFGPGDLVVEQLVTSNARVASELQRSVLEALRRHDRSGGLTSTLRAYLETGSVPETARREIVHANTVVYRLRRVAEITGFDPRVPVEAAVLVLALSSAL